MRNVVPYNTLNVWCGKVLA